MDKRLYTIKYRSPVTKKVITVLKDVSHNECYGQRDYMVKHGWLVSGFIITSRKSIPVSYNDLF